MQQSCINVVQIYSSVLYYVVCRWTVLYSVYCTLLYCTVVCCTQLYCTLSGFQSVSWQLTVYCSLCIVYYLVCWLYRILCGVVSRVKFAVTSTIGRVQCAEYRAVYTVQSTVLCNVCYAISYRIDKSNNCWTSNVPKKPLVLRNIWQRPFNLRKTFKLNKDATVIGLWPPE